MIDRKQLISHIPVKYLAYGLIKALGYSAAGLFRSRFQWKVTDVGNSLFPDADLRTYYELDNIRAILSPRIDGRLPRAAELGCGYGRITPVLGEYAKEVIGFEREPSLVRMARDVVRDIDIVAINKLTDMAAHGRFDLQMICTVLQHISDAECEEVVSAMKSAASKGGYVLIIENTDLGGLETIGDPKRGDKFLSRPRTVAYYEVAMKPFELIATAPRRLEKGYDVAGSLMLFKAP